MKRFISIALALTFILSLGALAYEAPVYNAKEVTVIVNDQSYTLLGYDVPGGETGIKVRDLAYILTGTSKQFNVYYQDGYVQVITGQPYTPIGAELVQYTGNEVTGEYSSHIFMMNGMYCGTEATLAADYNYVPVSTFCMLLDAYAEYNEDGSITIYPEFTLDDLDWG